MMTTYISTTDRAAIIRTALKHQHGWSSRQVSVRADYYSMGSSINVTIKDPNVPLDVVTTIAKQQERVDRDCATGEILSGGNRFVHISYSSAVLEQLRDEWMLKAEAAAGELANASGNGLVPIGPESDALKLGRESGDAFAIWHNGHFARRCHDLQTVATVAGVIFASTREAVQR